MNSPAQDRLGRLLGFLERDPGNLGLLADAASVAFEAGSPDRANDLLERHAAIAPLTPALLNLKGLVAMAERRFEDAAGIFEELRAKGGDDPALRFNLAWCRAMMADYQGALDLLDDQTIAASPTAPSLKIQMMHHLNLYNEALAEGQALAQRYPDNQALMGALATLAMDAEQADLARSYAQRAGDNAEGRAALGLLTLSDHNVEGSLALFDRALERQPGNARAWIGKGLALLMTGDKAEATKSIDKGAELFGDHLGSWVASGWAHFIYGDAAKARASFERAMAIDPNFAESHGGLAVLDIADGKLAEAKRRTEIALRLDRKCFGGALAQSLLLQQSGHPEMAKKVREIAMSTPIGSGGQTIAQAMVGFGTYLRK